MKLCILGDTHFGMRGDSPIFHSYCKKFYDDIFFPFLRENKITHIYQLGDLFDRRKYINFNTLFLCRKYFFDVIEKENFTLHTLLGNHDIHFKNTLEINSPKMLLGDYKHVTIHDVPTTISVDEIDIDIIPWMCLENQNDIHEFIATSKSQICFGHFEIAGFEMDRGNICHEGLDSQKLNKYDVVLSGHFHHKSSNGCITYVGTPGEMTWADYNDQRGFHVFDTDTRELTFVPNPYRMFHKLSYDDGQQDFEYWKNYNYEELKDCYVKVVVVNKQNPYLFDKVIDDLYKAGVADIAIVEDLTDTALDVDEDIINQAEDTMTILNKYIDGLTLNVEPDKLKNIMRELYVESLNVEVTE